MFDGPIAFVCMVHHKVDEHGSRFLVFFCVLVPVDFRLISQDYFTDEGAIMWLGIFIQGIHKVQYTNN